MKPEIGFMGQMTIENILDELDFAVKHEFDWYEIGLDWKQNYDLKPDVVKEMREISKEHEIGLIVHTPFYLPTSTMLPEVREGVIENARKAIILGERVGSDRLTIHPGYREMPGPSAHLCYESLIENLKRIVTIGNEHGVNICLENFDKNMHLLCSKLEDYLEVLDSVKGIKATLDVGHSNTTDIKPPEYFNGVKSFIMDMHVHDNDGKYDYHKCLGEGNIDFKKLFSECKKTNYYGPFILELFPYDNILKGKKIFLDLWERA